LGAAAFIIVNVVSGIVLGSYRQIGVMKAVGFTPGQVTGLLVGEIGAPATIGALVGVTVGAIAGTQITQQTAQAYGVPASLSDLGLIAIGVLGTVVAIAVVAAIVPAARAGRLNTVETLTRGTTPAGGRIGLV